MRLPRLKGLELMAIIVGAFTLWITSIAVPEAWPDGWLAVLAVCFGMLVLFLMLHGAFVLWSVRKQGRVQTLRVIAWMTVAALPLSLGVLGLIYLDLAQLVLDGAPDLGTPAGGMLALLVLWLLFSIMSVGLLAASCSAIWLLQGPLRWVVPRFLDQIGKARYDGTDPWYRKVAAWTVAFPRVLDPSTLRLDPEPLHNEAAKGRFYRALAWQMALGLLLAVYISLNPVLLRSMTFAQTFSLVSITSIVVPILILPWSTLEALGARVNGVREDFFLHRGARTRMVQTLVALGTLFLIVRLGIEEVGAETILLRFVSYSFTLLIISAVVSFAYFNYFEERLVRRLVDAGHEEGL